MVRQIFANTVILKCNLYSALCHMLRLIVQYNREITIIVTMVMVIRTTVAIFVLELKEFQEESPT